MDRSEEKDYQPIENQCCGNCDFYKVILIVEQVDRPNAQTYECSYHRWFTPPPWRGSRCSAWKKRK